VGLSAKDFDQEINRLAVRAHIRHRETGYDTLLMIGWNRECARQQVGGKLDRFEKQWREQ
jgi:hypothetical protein